MVENDDIKISKVQFDVEYKKYFTEYTDFDKIRKNVKSYKYLVEQLRKLDSNFNELDYKHIMSKKNYYQVKMQKKCVEMEFQLNILEIFC